MTPVLVDAADPVDAWKKVVALLATGDRFNVVVSIADPSGYTSSQLALYNPKSVCRSARSHEDVANTIFPKKTKWWARSVIDFTAHYMPAYRKLLAHGPRSWGMYFLRLVAFGAKRVNQLDKVVLGLSSWGHGHKAAFVVHFSSAELDLPRPQGAPCLQYCEFLVEDGEVSLLAVYRSHDYFLKALGNFVGLSRLLNYVALRSGLQVGSITCHSAYAYLKSHRACAVALASRSSVS